MIDGCLDWQAEGLIRPKSVQNATSQYFANQDLLSQWIEERCEVRLGDKLVWDRKGKLFQSWCDFCKRASEDPGAQKALTQELEGKGFISDRSHGGVRILRGIRVCRNGPR